MFFLRVYEFYFDFGWISGKMDEISKFRQFRGPMPQCRDPTQQRKSTLRHGMPTPRCDRQGGLDKPRRRPTPWHSTVHRHVFCHVLLFRYSEDLSIGLMRTL